MLKIESSLEAYLSRFGQKSHALARLVRQPDAGRGVVYTPREIAQQPYLWRRTARMMADHAPALKQFLGDAGLYNQDHKRPHVILAGAGTSDYIGLALADLLRTKFHTPCSNWPSTRITAAPYAFFVDDLRFLIIHFARSGNSPESKATLMMALKHSPETSRHIVITCNPDGELARLARDHPEVVYLILLDQRCNDRGLAMTSSFSNMVIAGQSLVHLEQPKFFTKLIDRIAAAGEHLIDTYADTIHALSDPELKRLFYLGNNDLIGAATESALKAQELTAGAMTAHGEDTLAFRHGPISAVDEQTMVTFFLSDNEFTRRYELDVLLQYQKAFRQIGAHIVVVTAERPPVSIDESVSVITYDTDRKWQIPSLYQTNIAVLYGQLFGLFAAYRRGINIDDPSVRKSLYSHTVQGVQLYEYVNGRE